MLEKTKYGSRGVDVAGHRLHQMLVVFPLGLLGGAVAFDTVHFIKDREPIWAEVSFWLIAAGVISALVAAVFGFIDWLGVPKQTRAKRVGAVHGIGNVIVVALFGLSWFMRRDSPTLPTGAEVALTFVGLALAIVTGWLGGELVARLGIGVHEGANVNAPSSLRRKSRAYMSPSDTTGTPTTTAVGRA